MQINHNGCIQPRTYFLLVFLMILFTTSQGALVVLTATERKVISRNGVASMLVNHDEQIVHVGTKRGCVDRYDIITTTTNNHHNKKLVFMNRCQEKVDTKSLPVFSMSHINDCLLCGCGDRYVAVLQTNNIENDNGFIIQRLGPHTGWVKDVVCFDQQQIFSIGCNYIESWKKQQDNSLLLLYQNDCGKRRFIESSTKAYTLSSDLLCLCQGPENLLFAGGVDGRIHAWSTTNNNNNDAATPFSSIVAHNGRINRLLYNKDKNCLFSVSHDGQLQARQVDETNCLEEPFAVLDLKSGKEDEFRITAIDCQSSSDCLWIFLGGAKGQIRFATLDGMVLRQETIQQQDEMFGKNVITAIKILSIEETRAHVLVGHSKGLELLEFNQDKMNE